MENTTTATANTATANTATTATPTTEQLVTLGLTAELYNSLPEATRLVLLKGLKPARATAKPVDLWSNTSLLEQGNDHSKAMCALALLLRDGTTSEANITQSDWTRATLALILATRAYKVEGKLACAEASTRTACGQARRWREIVDVARLCEKTKRVQLDPFEQAMFDYYRQRTLWPGKKDDVDKRMSVMAADLLREEWRKQWTENNDWRPCATSEEQARAFIELADTYHDDDDNDTEDNASDNGEI